ncbi:adenylate kinase [Peribacillus frigoritolerans]|uniref:adenylate kinase n=1 Tax=Peribacillus frigoritolerans TaxID=450367 RepID=UPI003CFE14CA
MNRSEFEARLNEVYSGTVTPVTRFINQRATLCFKCTKCGGRFFGKPNHMVGKKHQQHLCNMPYGDKNGGRLSKVGGRHKTKRKETFNIDQLNTMVWNDYTYQQIAQELKVNPDIVKDYFVKEGLI